jgi:hypothetical protein
VLAGETLELGLPRCTERQVATGLDDLAHEGGDEDLAAASLVRNPCREYDRLPEQVAILDDRLAPVHPDADAQRLGGA